MTSISTRYQECIPHDILDRGIYGATLGFVAQEESGKVYKLKKSLYGLEQSTRAWFGWFASSGVWSFSFSKNHLVFFRQFQRKNTYGGICR